MFADPPAGRHAGGAGIGRGPGSPVRGAGVVERELGLVRLDVVPVGQERYLPAVLRQLQLQVASLAFQDRAPRPAVERHDIRAVSRPVLRRRGKGQNGGLLGELVVGDPVVARLGAGGQVQQHQRGTVRLAVVGVLVRA